MTEYDYSPEAYEAYLATQAKISRWVDKTNRLYPYLGNPFTPATPAAHGSDLPQGPETDIRRPSPEKMEDWYTRARERERDRDRAGIYRDRPKEIGRGLEPAKSRDDDRYQDKRRERERDRDRYRDRAPDRESSEYHSDSRSRSHSRQAPIRSKTTPTLPSRAPHTRRASFDQYGYDRSKGEPKRRPSQSRPDVSSSKSKHSSISPKHESDGPSSTRRHFNSSSATHLPKIYPQPSRHRASASAHHLPAPTSAPPFTSHFQYPTNLSPTRRQPLRSRTMPPEDRMRGPPWLGPPPPPPPVIPPPVIPIIPTPQGAQTPGFHYRLKGGSGYPIERRVVPPPRNVLPPAHEKGPGHDSGGRKVVSVKPQLPLLKRLLTNLTLTKHSGPSPRSPSPENRRWRRRRSF